MKRLLTATDRRAAIRVLAGIPVRVRIRDLPKNIPTSFSGETADLSSHGASLLLKNSLPVSSRISLILDLAFPFPRLETDAEVVWTYFLPGDKKFNCGVQFLGLKKDYKKILREFTTTKSGLGETVPERRKTERRTKTTRRTTVIPDYDSNRRRVRDRRSFDRRQTPVMSFFRRLTKLVLQLIFLKKKNIKS